MIAECLLLIKDEIDLNTILVKEVKPSMQSSNNGYNSCMLL